MAKSDDFIQGLSNASWLSFTDKNGKRLVYAICQKAFNDCDKCSGPENLKLKLGNNVETECQVCMRHSPLKSNI